MYWVVDRNGTKRIEYIINGSHVVPATRMDRPDVPLVHPGYPDSKEGFDDYVSVNEGFITGSNTIEIRLISTDGAVFSLGTKTIQISVPTGCSVSADAFPCLDTALAVNVNKGNASTSMLKVTDSHGNVVQTFTVSNQSTVNVSFPDEGVYALTLESKNASGTNYAKTNIEVGGKTGKIASYYLNGAVTVKAYEDTQDALFYMASYDADGRFLGFSSQKFTLNAGERRTITPIISDGSKTLRLFTLDSLANLNTLQQVSTYTIE